MGTARVEKQGKCLLVEVGTRFFKELKGLIGAVFLSGLAVLASFADGATLSVEAGPSESTVTLGWNANTESDLAGYKLHYGLASGDYAQTVDVGKQTQYTLGELSEGATYYLALTAYNTAGLESDYSNEVTYTRPVSNAASGVEPEEEIVEVAEREDTARVSDGLQVLYTFTEGSGAVVNDVSGMGTALNLTIDDTSAVSWQNGALAVQSSALIASDGAATKLSQAVMASNEITLEAWVKSAGTDQGGPARIVTVSVDAYNRNMTLGQEGDTYEVRLRTAQTTSNGKPALETASGTLNTELTHVVYTRNADGSTRILVNGVETTSGSVPGSLSAWEVSSRIALANELNGDRPWLGEYHLVAVYSRALSTQEVAQNYSVGAAGVSNQLVEAEPENIAPVAVDGSYGVEAGTALVGLLSASDADSDALTYTLVTNGTLGTVEITNASTGAFSYTPRQDAVGTDTFAFKVGDGQAESSTATVTVEVSASSSADLRVTLAWNANTESDLAGYKLHYGTVSGNYAQTVDVGKQTQYTLGELSEGATYYLALTAYSTSGLESDYSNEVTYTVPKTSVDSTDGSAVDDTGGDGVTSTDPSESEDATGPASSGWVLPILVDGSLALTVGMSESATDGWDAGTDKAANAQTLVSLGTESTTELSRDLRSLSQVRQDWFLRLKGGESQATAISWDLAELPVEGRLIWSTLDATGAILPGSQVELSQVNQIELPAGTEYYRLSFVPTAETSETLQLSAGWNMVSFALDGADDTLAGVFGTTTGMVVWTFDADTQVYQTAEEIQPGVGYWVYAASALTIEHVGVPAITATVSLKTGWNLVGAVAEAPLPAGSFSFTWDGAAQLLTPVSSLLEPGFGYWIYSQEDQDVVLR
jgi:fibronectin type 3 domain-containing protein